MALTKKQRKQVEELVAEELAAWEKWYKPRLEAAFAQANAAKNPMTDEEFEELRARLRQKLAGAKTGARKSKRRSKVRAAGKASTPPKSSRSRRRRR